MLKPQFLIVLSLGLLFLGCRNEECGDDTPTVDLFIENYTWEKPRILSTSCIIDYPIPPASQISNTHSATYSSKDYIEYELGTQCNCGAIVNRFLTANDLQGGGEIFRFQAKADIFGDINQVIGGNFQSRCIPTDEWKGLNTSCGAILPDNCGNSGPIEWHQFDFYRNVDPATSYFSQGVTTGSFYIQWEDSCFLFCCKQA